MINQTCCFTGHRRIPLDQLESVTQRLRDAVIASIKDGYLYFGAGGALGFDTLAAQTVLNLKKDYPQIKLILVLPCKTQARGWKQEDIEEYNRIMKAADKVVYTSQDYYSGCMHKRNRHLVDNSSRCICFLNEKTGGTFYTVNYASEHGLMIINTAKLLSQYGPITPSHMRNYTINEKRCDHFAAPFLFLDCNSIKHIENCAEVWYNT